jgi:TRAP transporter TAXI family solute receptor
MKKVQPILSVLLIVGLALGFSVTAQAAEEKPKKEVTFITGNFGSVAFLVAQQFAMEVNRSHPWLKIKVKEGKPSNIHELANKPEIRKDTFVMSATFTNWMAQKGLPSSKAPYHTAKALTSCAGVLAVPIFTNKEEIRTLHDLKGKRVNLWTKGSQGEMTFTALLKHIGIYDTVKGDYNPFEPAVDGMVDNLIDATVGYAALIGTSPNKFSPVPSFIRMFESRKIWVVDIPAELQKEASKATGVPISPIRVPAGSITKGIPDRDVTTFPAIIWMYADETFPEELAYEVCKQFATHMEALRKTSPAAAALSVEKMATSDIGPEAYHPGALRFFKESNIKVVIGE